MKPAVGCSVITGKRSSGGIANASIIARCTPSPSALRYSALFPARRSMRTSGINCLLYIYSKLEANEPAQPLSLAQLVPRKIPQPVIRRVFVHLGQRRIVEHQLDDLTNRQPLVEPHHAHMDQPRRRPPNHTPAEQLPARLRKNQLKHPRRVTGYVSARIVVIPRPPHTIVDL